MPYLDEDTLAQIADGAAIDTPGKLNWDLTTTLIRYVRLKGLSYATINDIMGALEGAKHEFYFRVAFPYEQAKMRANGDVYQDIAPGE